MALRIVEAHVPADLEDDAREVLADLSHETWVQPGGRFGAIVFGVLGAGRTGEALDRLHEKLANRGDCSSSYSRSTGCSHDLPPAARVKLGRSRTRRPR